MAKYWSQNENARIRPPAVGGLVTRGHDLRGVERYRAGGVLLVLVEQILRQLLIFLQGTANEGVQQETAGNVDQPKPVAVGIQPDQRDVKHPVISGSVLEVSEDMRKRPPHSADPTAVRLYEAERPGMSGLAVFSTVDLFGGRPTADFD